MATCWPAGIVVSPTRIGAVVARGVACTEVSKRISSSTALSIRSGRSRSSARCSGCWARADQAVADQGCRRLVAGENWLRIDLAERARDAAAQIGDAESGRQCFVRISERTVECGPVVTQLDLAQQSAHSPRPAGDEFGLRVAVRGQQRPRQVEEMPIGQPDVRPVTFDELADRFQGLIVVDGDRTSDPDRECRCTVCCDLDLIRERRRVIACELCEGHLNDERLLLVADQASPQRQAKPSDGHTDCGIDKPEHGALATRVRSDDDKVLADRDVELSHGTAVGDLQSRNTHRVVYRSSLGILHQPLEEQVTMCARCCQIACRLSLMFQAAITGRRVSNTDRFRGITFCRDDRPPSGDDLRRQLEVCTRSAARAARMT